MNLQSLGISGKIKTVLYIIGGLIVLLIIVRVLRTGKRKAKEIKKEDKIQAVQDLRTMEYFNPDFKVDKIFNPIGDNAADLYAEQLRKAVRGLGTNEERIYSTFSKLKCKANISEVAARYYLKFRRDLRTDILNDLNDKEKVLLLGIINQMPELT